MGEEKVYPTEPLRCWSKAKELRFKYYKDYVGAKEKGGIRWSGSAWAFNAIPSGLGEDVYSVTGEPYGATSTYFENFSLQCLEAAEKAGIARDLCGYLRNYWGGLLLDKFIMPDGTILDKWPVADFLFSSHVCCSHAKWYQHAGELEGGIPLQAIDVSVGPYPNIPDREGALRYIVQQMNESIEMMQEVTGRDYSDELLIEAIKNECRSFSLWAEICTYNKNIPAPLDEKTMYSLYVLTTLNPQRKEVADFYHELRDEVRDRAERGIAAVAQERYRVITDSQPPWAALQVFRHMEKEYGAVSVGSWYTFGLMGAFDEESDGTIVPFPPPQDRGLSLKTREEALQAYADYRLRNWGWRIFQSVDERLRITNQLVDQWKVDALISHLNKGCEGTSIGILEARLDLLKRNVPVLTFEGNMADTRDFDLERTLARIDTFLDGVGLKKLTSQ
jgi:benzoyl-CoA reductase subunit B